MSSQNGATDDRRGKRHTELRAHSVQHQPKPWIRLSAIPGHHRITPTVAQHPNCLRNGLDRVLDEHQAVAINHRVKAGITKVNRALVEHRSAQMSLAARAPGRNGDHLAGDIRQNLTAGRTHTLSGGKPRAPRTSRQIENAITRTDLRPSSSAPR